jgi:hypothetical protein
MTFTSKSLLTICTLATAVLLMTASCKKSNSSSSSGGLSATYGTTSFQSSTTVGVYYQTASMVDLIGYTISSGDTTVTEVGLSTPFTLNTPVSSDTVYSNYINYYDSKGALNYYGGFNVGYSPVIITVTSWDTVNKKITGTFSGTLYGSSNDSVVATKGQFNMSYLSE